MSNETDITAYVCDICGREMKNAIGLRAHRDACLAKQQQAKATTFTVPPAAAATAAEHVPSDRMGQETAIPAKESASPAAMMSLTAALADLVQAYSRANGGRPGVPTAVADVQATIGRIRSQIGRLPA